ncbi:hypothetical protein FGIG_10479 [Fasciola gigantica]|uniref:Uncharacterized protein n=1 Tax=Fasciola gigantica TaxID=46835 RepID=A0A504Y969_FASGI|nr:hypothetical protein FGIG_10479 [Fasciola gigantica]
MPSRTASLGLLQKCEYVAPGKIGVCRKSMLTRETLQRPKLGQSFLRGRPKQPKGFTYGIAYPRNPYEIYECFTWPTERKGTQIDPACLPRDFHRINVESTKEGIHPVPEWIRFANEKNYRLNPTKRALGRLRKPKFPDEMVFGMCARPSTPIHCVLSHQYKTIWDNAALEVNKRRMTTLVQSQNDIPQPLDSVASVLNTVPLGFKQNDSSLNAAPTKPWIMPRFRNQNPRIYSHWSAEDAQRVLREKSSGRKKRADPAFASKKEMNSS